MKAVRKNILIYAFSIIILVLFVLIGYYYKNKIVNTSVIEDFKEEISKDNSHISIDKEKNEIVIEKYKGNADSLIIDKYIDGKKCGKIKHDAFSESDRLKNIFIDKELTCSNIDGFQIDIYSEDDQYVKLINVDKVTLNENNCKYTVGEKSDKITITEYNGNARILIIEKEIGDKEIEKINKDAFAECTNLEKILIKVQLSDEEITINDFKMNSDSKMDGYIEYITTKEYSYAYQEYLKLSDEEKEKLPYIPHKYDISADVLYSQSFQEMYNLENTRSINIEELPSRYDLRDEINVNVKNQYNSGICFAFTGTTCIETNLAKRNGINVNLSPIHLANLTVGGAGGDGSVIQSSHKYYNQGIGAVTDKIWPITRCKRYFFEKDEKRAEIGKNLYTNIIKMNAITFKEKQDLQRYLIELSTLCTKYKVTESVRLGWGWGNSLIDKEDQVLELMMQMIKKHIKKYGALFSEIDHKLLKDNGKEFVYNSSDKPVAIDHAVSIIGWDDNFSKEKFPEDCRPKKDGAYLVLNSWGENWSDNGCFWVSYESRYFIRYIEGVISVEVNEGNDELIEKDLMDFEERANILDKIVREDY